MTRMSDPNHWILCENKTFIRSSRVQAFWPKDGKVVLELIGGDTFVFPEGLKEFLNTLVELTSKDIADTFDSDFFEE